MLGEKLMKLIGEERDNRPAAVIIDPMTGVPDFEGYRPMESELPQQQPAAELIQHEVSGESADEVLARVFAEHQRKTSGKETEDEHGSI